MEKLQYFEVCNQRYPVICSFAAIAALDERFGSLDAMNDAFHSGKPSNVVRAFDDAMEIFLAEGRTYAMAYGMEVPPPLPCKPSSLVHILENDKLFGFIQKLMDGDTSRQVETEDDGKNAEATPGR